MDNQPNSDQKDSPKPIAPEDLTSNQPTNLSGINNNASQPINHEQTQTSALANSLNDSQTIVTSANQTPAPQTIANQPVVPEIPPQNYQNAPAPGMNYQPIQPTAPVANFAQPGATNTPTNQTQPAVPNFQPNTVIPPNQSYHKKTNVGLIVGLALGGMALLIGVVLLLIFVVFAKPTAADYKAAYNKVDEVGEALLSVSSASCGEYAIKEDSDAVTKYVNKVNTAKNVIVKNLTELRTMKAVAGDEDVRKIYDDVKADLDKVKASLEFMTEYCQNIVGPLAALNDISIASGKEDIVKKINASLANLEKVSSKDERIKKVVDDLKVILKKMRTILEKVNSSGDYIKLMSEINDAMDEFDKIEEYANEPFKNSIKNLDDADDQIHNLWLKLSDKITETE